MQYATLGFYVVLWHLRNTLARMKYYLAHRKFSVLKEILCSTQETQPKTHANHNQQGRLLEKTMNREHKRTLSTGNIVSLRKHPKNTVSLKHVIWNTFTKETKSHPGNNLPPGNAISPKENCFTQ